MTEDARKGTATRESRLVASVDEHTPTMVSVQLTGKRISSTLVTDRDAGA